MTGQLNVQKLKEREATTGLFPSDRPMLGLIELARLKLDDLMNPQDTQELKNKLQGASNHLSKQILKYWSQNKHLHVQFDLRTALPKDPPEMNQAGTMNDGAKSAMTRMAPSCHSAVVRKVSFGFFLSSPGSRSRESRAFR